MIAEVPAASNFIQSILHLKVSVLFPAQVNVTTVRMTGAYFIF